MTYKKKTNSTSHIYTSIIYQSIKKTSPEHITYIHLPCLLTCIFHVHILKGHSLWFHIHIHIYIMNRPIIIFKYIFGRQICDKNS